MKICIKIFPNEQGGFTATCPSLPGCVCHGETREQVKENLDEAIKGYIAAVSNFVPENLQEEVVEV